MFFGKMGRLPLFPLLIHIHFITTPPILQDIFRHSRDFGRLAQKKAVYLVYTAPVRPLLSKIAKNEIET
jgi:hypothetical protein